MSVSNGGHFEKTKRINCRNCGHRVHADLAVCPHCHVDPHTRRPLSSNLLIAIISIVVLAFGCVLIALFLVNPLSQFAALGLRSQPTAVIQIIYAVATQLPPTLTSTPTAIPSSTLTPSPRFSPTPTRKGAPTITATRPPPSPTSSDYGVPRLTTPANNATFFGAEAQIVLEWQSVVANGLRENEWYLVKITYTGRSGVDMTQSGWSRETRWVVKKDWWTDASVTARAFTWNVQLMRVDGANPYSSPTSSPATPPSETRKFVWQ